MIVFKSSFLTCRFQNPYMYRIIYMDHTRSIHVLYMYDPSCIHDPYMMDHVYRTVLKQCFVKQTHNTAQFLNIT